MSHASAILTILEREIRRREFRAARYAALHDALRRSHEGELRSAALLELAETVVVAAAAARARR